MGKINENYQMQLIKMKFITTRFVIIKHYSIEER